MRRSLFNLLTLLSLLLLLFAVVLWLRSGGNDVIILRTARSYSGWPNVKRIVIRPYDGWVVSFHHKFVPLVDAGPPRWRQDVPLSFKRLQPPTYRNTVPMIDAERQAFDGAASKAYGSEPWLRWRTRPPGRGRQNPAPILVMSTWLTAAGVDYYADTFLIDDAEFPGAYRDVRVGVPHGVVIAVASLLPAFWIGLWARRLRNERARRRSGRCPSCGYDLRESRERCPECGRAIDAGARTQPTESSGESPPARRRLRWELAVFAAVVVVLALAVMRGWNSNTVPVAAKPPAPSWQPEAGTFHPESVTAEYGPVRFHAVWHNPQWHLGTRGSLAEFDLTGPLSDTAQPLQVETLQVAIDPDDKEVYGATNHGPPFIVGLAGTALFARGGRPRMLEHCTGVAFDARRRRLVVAGGYGFGSSIYTYDVGSGAWSNGVEVGLANEVVALAYSAEHDCVYAVVAPTRLDPPTVVRLTPNGDPEWRVPLLESIPEARPGVRRWSYQLAASGKLLALIRSDDVRGRGPSPQTMTLIDPTAGRIVYRGTLTPHTSASALPTTAPARAE